MTVMSTMSMQRTVDIRPIEVSEFLDTLDCIAPGALTSCPARTAHLLGAHVAGNYREITRHVEAYMAGTPLMRTRHFDEREPEFRVMSAPELMRSIDEGGAPAALHAR